MIHLAQEERNKTFTDDNTMRWDSGEVRRREAPAAAEEAPAQAAEEKRHRGRLLCDDPGDFRYFGRRRLADV